MTDTLTTVVPTKVSWRTPTSSRWVAYQGATRVGSIDLVGAYIATGQQMDLIGAFSNLAEAQRAIADPQPEDTDLASARLTSLRP